MAWLAGPSATPCSTTVGMTRKQDGGSNECISVYTAILSPGSKCQRLKALKAAYAAPVYSSTKSVRWNYSTMAYVKQLKQPLIMRKFSKDG